MRNNIKKIILIFLLIAGFYTFFYINRYKISSPMEDYEYKKNIIKSSWNLNYKLENLRPLVGPEELAKFIKENNNNPEIYTPNEKNIKNGIYRANLHMHTTNSDGKAKVAYLMNQAETYAKENLNNKPMYIAITDHNTVLGTKEIIEVLQKNPNKYNNIKVIAGIEIFTGYKTKFSEKPIEIHVLTWCINPYDKFLNKEFYKKDLKDKWNRTRPDRDFNKVINTMSDYGIVGIAHPARYLDKITNKEDYIKELLNTYRKESKNKVLFLEGYYQTYPLIIKNYDNKFKAFLSFINSEASKNKIYRTGSTDVHGYSIFKK